MIPAHATVIEKIFAEHSAVLAEAASVLPEALERAVAMADECLRGGRKLLVCGNGGSAAHAQHLAAELVVRYRAERRALPAIALTTDGATLTAIGNDLGYEQVFARQVEALGSAGDLLIAISTSGNSPNVVRAAETARSLGLGVVALTGAAGGRLSEQAHLTLRAPSTVVARIQEVHTVCVHALAEALERRICADE